MRRARIGFLALLDSAKVEPVELHPALDFEVRMRATDGGRFDEAVSGRAQLALSSMEAWMQHEVARCQRYATVDADADESEARPILESIETLFSSLADDLTWVLDRSTNLWRAAAEVRQKRAFSVEDHFIVVVEAVERAPGVGHLVRTRGLEKFARPDVGMRVPRAQAESAAALVREVARKGASGERFSPGRRLEVQSRSFGLWPRSDDCLASLPPDEAPLYELREGGLALLR